MEAPPPVLRFAAIQSIKGNQDLADLPLRSNSLAPLTSSIQQSPRKPTIRSHRLMAGALAAEKIGLKK